MEEMNKIEELVETAGEVVSETGLDIPEGVNIIDLPASVETESSGKGLKIALGVTAAAAAVGGLVYGAVKLAKRFRKRKAEKEEAFNEDGWYDEDNYEEIDPNDEASEEGETNN